MKPGAKQTLTVDLISDSKIPVTVYVSAISASTNRNGVIDYRTPNIKDHTLRVPFSEISLVKDDKVTIPAGGTAVARVEVSMPSGVYDGVALGGIAVTKKAEEGVAAPDGSPRSMGVSVKNEYSYIIGVKLSETDVRVSPDFEYDKVEAGLANYQPAVIHYIRNKEAAIVKDMRLYAKVYKGNAAAPYIDFSKTVDMAPNSVMPIGTETGGREFEPGDYRSKLRLVIGDKVWEFEKGFTVTAKEAEKTNAASVVETKNTDMPEWLKALLAATAILSLLALILLLILLLKRRRDDGDDDGNAEGDEYRAT
jgi:hypothetical protein